MIGKGEINIMKKVSLFGKKLMSLGLVASLCITSLGIKNCFAEGPESNQQNLITINGSVNVNNNYVNNQQPQDGSLNVNNYENDQQPQTGKNKQDNSHNGKGSKIDKAKELLKKVWTVYKWTAVSGFLVYAGYKNSRDIINLGKECRNFILENKENFKEVLDGGIAAVKGMGQTIYGAVQLICMLVKFVCEHKTATKNILALVGSYNIYSYLKNKVENFCASRENKNTEFKVREIVKRN